jgi:uncharacterized repeat protein (TIGR03803 family)
VEGSDGALYGTTHAGGAYGVGTAFKLNKDGSDFNVLHSFSTNGGDGQFPSAAVVEGSDGALYGTTSAGGANTNQYGDSFGTVFKLNKDGNGYAILHNFGASGADGQNPFTGLVQGSDGAFYGTTFGGGYSGFGTAFKIWPPETPDMIGVTMATNSVQVSFAGEGGYRYQVLRSTNLTNWTVLATVTMPAGGIYTNVDNAPPTPTAYYRAVWTP